MTKSEKLYYEIVSDVPDAQEGKMFGALCIKMRNGKAAAILWEGHMMFKLDEASQEEALRLDGARIGAHLYNPDKPMNGWVSLPLKHSDQWLYFAKKAVAFDC